jgi:hypothetical protein
MDFVHGFESIVLEYFFPHFIPDIFLRVQLGRVRWEEMQNYISGDLKFVSAVVAGSVHNKQDQLLGIFLRQGLQKNLEAFGIGRRHHQVDASSVLRADRAIQIDVFTNELAGDLWADADGCPARSRAVHPTEARFVGEHDAQATATPGGSPSGFPDSIGEPFF